MMHVVVLGPQAPKGVRTNVKHKTKLLVLLSTHVLNHLFVQHH